MVDFTSRRAAGLAVANLVMVLALSCAAGARAADDDAAALAATWARARIYLPAEFNPLGSGAIGGRRDWSSIAAALAAIPAGRTIPMVLYLHGCGGFGHSGSVNSMMLAGAGYMVIAPDSFARPDRIRTCDSKRHIPIVPRAVNSRVRDMRIAELRYALSRLGEFPWVDRDNLFLFGHSQGAVAAAEYRGREFRARIVSGTRCIRGIGARRSEPMLAVFSTHDPWFRDPKVRNCRDRARSPNVEVLELPGRDHLVAKVPEARRAMIAFLARHTRR